MNLRLPQGLESWSTAPEHRSLFRQKVWGGFNMLPQVMFNKEKWMAAILLDPVTGLDPPGGKVRAAEGIDAASSFMQGYWLWYVRLKSPPHQRAYAWTLKVQDRRESCRRELRYK